MQTIKIRILLTVKNWKFTKLTQFSKHKFDHTVVAVKCHAFLNCLMNVKYYTQSYFMSKPHFFAVSCFCLFVCSKKKTWHSQNAVDEVRVFRFSSLYWTLFTSIQVFALFMDSCNCFGGSCKFTVKVISDVELVDIWKTFFFLFFCLLKVS